MTNATETVDGKVTAIELEENYFNHIMMSLRNERDTNDDCELEIAMLSSDSDSESDVQVTHEPQVRTRSGRILKKPQRFFDFY